MTEGEVSPTTALRTSLVAIRAAFEFLWHTYYMETFRFNGAGGRKTIDVPFSIDEYSYANLLAFVGDEDAETDWSFATAQGFVSVDEAQQFVKKQPDRRLYELYAVARRPEDGLYYVARKAGGKLSSSRRSVA